MRRLAPLPCHARPNPSPPRHAPHNQALPGNATPYPASPLVKPHRDRLSKEPHPLTSNPLSCHALPCLTQPRIAPPLGGNPPDNRLRLSAENSALAMPCPASPRPAEPSLWWKPTAKARSFEPWRWVPDHAAFSHRAPAAVDAARSAGVGIPAIWLSCNQSVSRRASIARSTASPA
jgi:hypothetical protein